MNEIEIRIKVNNRETYILMPINISNNFDTTEFVKEISECVKRYMNKIDEVKSDMDKYKVIANFNHEKFKFFKAIHPLKTEHTDGLS